MCVCLRRWLFYIHSSWTCRCLWTNYTGQLLARLHTWALWCSWRYIWLIDWLIVIGGVRNPIKISDIGFLKIEPNRTDLKIQKPKTRFPWFGFQKPTSAVWGRFSRCLIHNSSCSMIGSTVNVFFFMPYLCTSSSESLRLTICWTNSARK